MKPSNWKVPSTGRLLGCHRLRYRVFHQNATRALKDRGGPCSRTRHCASRSRTKAAFIYEALRGHVRGSILSSGCTNQVSLRMHASALCAACIAVAPEQAEISLHLALVMHCAVHVVGWTQICPQLLRLTCMPLYEVITLVCLWNTMLGRSGEECA